jgi:hypothetical protein
VETATAMGTAAAAAAASTQQIAGGVGEPQAGDVLLPVAIVGDPGLSCAVPNSVLVAAAAAPPVLAAAIGTLGAVAGLMPGTAAPGAAADLLIAAGGVEHEPLSSREADMHIASAAALTGAAEELFGLLGGSLSEGRPIGSGGAASGCLVNIEVSGAMAASGAQAGSRQVLQGDEPQ